MNGITGIIRAIVLFEGAVAFGLAFFTLIEYWRRWKAGSAGALPQHIALMAMSYLILVGTACAMIAELILGSEFVTGQTIREHFELRWYRAPLTGLGLIFGVMGLGRLLRYERGRRKVGT